MLVAPAARAERNREIGQRLFDTRKSAVEMARVLGLPFVVEVRHRAGSTPTEVEAKMRQLLGGTGAAIVHARTPRSALDVDKPADVGRRSECCASARAGACERDGRALSQSRQESPGVDGEDSGGSRGDGLRELASWGDVDGHHEGHAAARRDEQGLRDREHRHRRQFVIHDLRVVNGDKGLFVAMPSRKLPNGEFRDICHPINTDARNAIQEAVLEQFEVEGGVDAFALPRPQPPSVEA